MISCNYSIYSSPRVPPQELYHKWLGVAALVSFVSTLYLFSGQFSALQDSSFLSPLKALPLQAKRILLAVCASTFLVTLVVYFSFDKKEPALSRLSLTLRQAFASSTNLQVSSSFHEVEKFIQTPYGRPLEQHTFYYHLNSLADLTRQGAISQENFDSLLEALDGQQLPSKKAGFSPIQIDCSYARARVRGTVPQWEIKKWDESLNSEESLQRLHHIWVAAFASNGNSWNFEFTKNYLNEIQEDVYVICDKTTGKISGTIGLRDEENRLFIHSLAREAGFAKTKMTEAIKDWFETSFDSTKYEYFCCDVDVTNLPAQHIYKSLGFVEEWRKGGPHPHIRMRYTPKKT